MTEQSKKKHKKNKKNEVSESGISETELAGNDVGIKGCEHLDNEDMKGWKNDKGKEKEKKNDKGKEKEKKNDKGKEEEKKNDKGKEKEKLNDKGKEKGKKNDKRKEKEKNNDKGEEKEKKNDEGKGKEKKKDKAKKEKRNDDGKEKEKKNDIEREKEKNSPKKKKPIEDSYDGITERKKADEKEQVRMLVTMGDHPGYANEKLENKNKKRDKDNGHLNVSNIRGNVNQQDQEVETVKRVSDGDSVGKVGKKKRKRERNKCVIDEGASWEDITQLNETGKEDMKSQNAEHIEEFDEGHKRKLGKRKKKREMGKETDAPSAAREGTLAKKNNPMRADLTMHEEQEKNRGIWNTEGKSKNSVENRSQDSRSQKKSKKVSFSANVEVFPSSRIVPNGTEKSKDLLIRGKRFSKEEDEIVRQAVLNYIDENGLGDEGLNMVLNCQSNPKTRRCWKEIATCIPYRPYLSIYHRAQILFRRSKDRKWTEEECKMVREFYKQHGPKWKVLADEMGKHRFHVKDKWRLIKVENLKKGRWDQEEYQNLFNLVNKDFLAKIRLSEEKKSKHGMLRDNIPWSAISDKLTTRSNAMCCKKWYDQLSSPMVAEGRWADSDDYRLVDALYQLDASCIEDVDWDNLVDGRSGDVSRKRWKQMVLHIGQHSTKSFAEQVEVLAKRYCPDLLDARVAWENKPFVD